MTGYIDRNTGKVTIIKDGRSAEETKAIVRALLSAARLAEGAKRNG